MLTCSKNVELMKGLRLSASPEELRLDSATFHMFEHCSDPHTDSLRPQTTPLSTEAGSTTEADEWSRTHRGGDRGGDSAGGDRGGDSDSAFMMFVMLVCRFGTVTGPAFL